MSSSTRDPHLDVDYPTRGEPTVRGSKRRLVFESPGVVDWRCPECGDDGFVDLHRHGPKHSLCTTSTCRVKLFSVFGGEPDGQE